MAKRIVAKRSSSTKATTGGATASDDSLATKDMGCRIRKMLGKLKYIRDHSKKTTEDEKKDCIFACTCTSTCTFACTCTCSCTCS